MNYFLAVVVLTVLNCINVANGDCTAATGAACRTNYNAANTTTDPLKCTAAYTYGTCLVNADCNNGTYLSNFIADVGDGFKCDNCTLSTAVGCLEDDCSGLPAVKTCLDNAMCNTGVFNTVYTAYVTKCNGCGTVTFSVLMMFLSTLLLFIKI
ncbi:hypothetical protein SNE40_016183 [Patella caerulea]|uniref:Uncharacterized protein n=1 Tax=Patella caerulea TaxID=87958 RepID=A0AAN8J8V0_PATCE